MAAGPSDIVAAAIRGGRELIAQQSPTVEAQPTAVCCTVLHRMLGKAEVALKGCHASNPNDQKGFDLHEKLVEQADREYRRGFVTPLPDPPRLNVIAVQARMFVALFR